MTIKCEKCNQQPKCALWCLQCEHVCCTKCYPSHSSHHNKIQFICQECEEAPDQQKTVFCESCQQHLCCECSERIHNKGKRAKHVLHNTTFQTLKIKKVYIACEDVLGYYGYINYGALLMDIADIVPAEETFLLMLEKYKQTDNMKNKILVVIRSFNSDTELSDDFCLNSKAEYPFLQQVIFIESHRSCKLYENVKETKQIKTTLHRLGQVMQKPVHNIANISMSSISLQNNSLNSKSNISAKYPRETRNHLSINISSSTQNSLRKRKRKSPILYFHPFTLLKGDKRSSIQNFYRDQASKGTLMIKKANCKIFEEGVLRAFYRNIGQTEVQYVSLLLDTISIECIYWVIRSIQEDLMAPTQKLILSRLKESFDIKVHSKLWNHILKYLSSNEYENDKLEVDPMSNIPRLIVKPFNSQDSYILYCKSDNYTPVQWSYQDLGKLNENSTEWKQFIQMIDEYFVNNSQIGGGRYGCVQYIKFNAKRPLKDCSLGKLSMFVQESINKGVMRYHKTLLVSNRQNEESQHSEAQTDNKQGLSHLQKSIKVQTLQVLLFENFKQFGPGQPISLAQIPQNLRKSANFQINYIELGFPKLKNFLVTLSNMLTIDLSKSHITYQLTAQTQDLIKQKRDKLSEETSLLIEQVIKELVQIIDNSKLAGMAMEQLYNQFSMKTGLSLDFMLFNTTDFYQFLAYYGQNYFDIQVHMGYFLVYKKWSKTVEPNQATSTPTFRQADSEYKMKNLQSFEWCQSSNIWLDEGNKGYGFLQKEQEQQQNESQSFSDYKSIYNLIDDDSESVPKTVIVKQGSSKQESQELMGNQIETGHGTQPYSHENSKQGSVNQLQELSEKLKIGNNKQHIRMYSNNIKQRTQHNRVYSNMSRD